LRPTSIRLALRERVPRTKTTNRKNGGFNPKRYEFVQLCTSLRPDPKGFTSDPFTNVLRDGTRKLIEQAIHAELDALMSAFSRERLEDGRPRLDRDAPLTFYDFPAEHWKHIRTSNPIESTFAIVRHRTKRTKGCLSRKTGLAMAHKLMMSAQKKWRKLDGQNRHPEIIQGVEFRDGLRQVQAVA
jgi:transposase-like protein